MAGKQKSQGEESAAVVGVRVTVPESVKNGVYANLVNINTTSEGEVIFDFVFTHPQEVSENIRQGSIVSRVILPLSVAKRVSTILMAHLGRPKEA